MKVVLVLSDALRDDIAAERMGFLEHLIETRQGTRYSVRGELPTLSRPMYETVHTGLPVTQHGIYSNQVVRRSSVPNVFEIAVRSGRSTAAAAHYWFSELYIQNGSFLRLDNLQIGYSLPSSLLSKAGLGYLRFYLAGQNLITFTKYTGYDPEIAQYPGSDATIGVDQSVYPTSRMYTFGADFTF